MGSTNYRRIAVPLSIAALALAPATGASASPVKDYSQNGATGDYTPQRVFKDYSRNGATGDFTPAVTSSAPTTVAVAHDQSSFSWGAAAVGAASTLILVLLVGATSRRVRRRRISAPSPARPTAA
jgi:hypothetical protein